MDEKILHYKIISTSCIYLWYLILHFRKKLLNNTYIASLEILQFYKDYVHTKPIFSIRDYPELNIFNKYWEYIRSEIYNYLQIYLIPTHKSIEARIVPDFEGEWNVIYLKAFGNYTNVSKAFPETSNLLHKIPCISAYFSVIHPGTKILPHVGIFKGVIRYHLGIKVPNDKDNCFINVNGKKLSWEEGGCIIFDDTFVHFVENNTDEFRIVLIIDVIRKFDDVCMSVLNDCIINITKDSEEVKKILYNTDIYSFQKLKKD